MCMYTQNMWGSSRKVYNIERTHYNTQKENANLFVLIYKLQHIESELAAAAAAAFFFIEIYVTASTPNKYKPSYMRGQKWGGISCRPQE